MNIITFYFINGTHFQVALDADQLYQEIVEKFKNMPFNGVFHIDSGVGKRVSINLTHVTHIDFSIK